MTVGVVIMIYGALALFFGLMWLGQRGRTLPDPHGPGLSSMQRVGAARARQVARWSKPLVLIGLGGIALGGVTVLIALVIS